LAVFPFQFMVAMLCGWSQREQEDVIAFLREENRVLKARLAGRRLRLDDSERRRLAELGHRLGRHLLAPPLASGRRSQLLLPVMTGRLVRVWDITGVQGTPMTHHNLMEANND
jgi:hypothetical protein